MYEDFYGLKERPFTLVPDPDYLYLGSQHKLARAYLEYGLKEQIGFVVLTGEVGTGKTTLIKSLLRAKEVTQRLGVLYQTAVEAEDLLDLLLQEFQVRGHFASRAARLGAFNQFLLSSHARGEHVVLVVDEAQNLGAKALEELRLLSNLQADKEPLLQVFLVGQPGLRERLRHPALRQLAQRVTIHYHLSPWTRMKPRTISGTAWPGPAAAAFLPPRPWINFMIIPKGCPAGSTPGVIWPWWLAMPRDGMNLMVNLSIW
jgi:general secretion pathway protein A